MVNRRGTVCIWVPAGKEKENGGCAVVLRTAALAFHDCSSSGLDEATGIIASTTPVKSTVCK